MAINNKIPIIRALWGSVPRSKSEVFRKPIFANEIVVVWGQDNYEYLTKLGYQTVVADYGITDARYSTIHSHFMHKLLAIQHASKIYDEFIFLDWDCYLLKPMDDNFYQELRDGNEVQVPLYAYHNRPGIGIIDVMTHPANERYDNKPSEDLIEYIKSHEEQLRKYCWEYEDTLVTPNFSFFYTRLPKVCDELIEITLENNILNCIEEHAFFKWTNCTLDEYIERFEPTITYGTHPDTRTHMLRGGYDVENDPVIKINKYIETKVNKNIYFKHI